MTSSTNRIVPDGGSSGHLDGDDDDVWEAEERSGHCCSAMIGGRGRGNSGEEKGEPQEGKEKGWGGVKGFYLFSF